MGENMTRRLRRAIDDLLESLNGRLVNFNDVIDMLRNLEHAYKDHRVTMTETSKRIEFLEECLEKGISKRQAARMLSEHDPRVGRRTAENLVYTNFSGQYQTSLRGRRKSELTEPVKIVEAVVPNVLDDESIL